MNFIRLLFCIYNFIFLILGAVVLGIGIWFAADTNIAEHLEKLVKTADANQVTDSTVGLIKNAGFVLIAFGGVVFFLSFVGYCGAVKQSRFLLAVYTFVLTLILILQIVVVILIFAVYGPDIETKTKEFLVKQLGVNYTYPERTISSPSATPTTRNEFSKAMDLVMIKYECCGINNASEFQNVRVPSSQPGAKVPFTCCKCREGSKARCKALSKPEDVKDLEFQECQTTPTLDNSNIGYGGCYEKLREKVLSSKVQTIGIIVAVAIGLLQLLGIIFGIYTYKKSK